MTDRATELRRMVHRQLAHDASVLFLRATRVFDDVAGKAASNVEVLHGLGHRHIGSLVGQHDTHKRLQLHGNEEVKKSGSGDGACVCATR